MSDTVIRVVFGPGGGRADRDVKPLKSRPGSPEPSQLFTRAEAARLLGLSDAQLRRLEREGVALSTGSRAWARGYTFADVSELRSVAALFARGLGMAAVLRAVRAARASLLCAPLSAFRFEVLGKRVVVHLRGGSFEPLSGQTLLPFVAETAAAVHVLRPPGARDQERLAYELYLRASKLDEDAATMEAAQRLYERAIELDPELAIAYTNLGNVHHRRGDAERAQDMFERALALDPRQPEAQYNLGYLLLQRGDTSDAVPLLLGSIQSDPKFADACFNLASALDLLGRESEAQVYWRRYLALEPRGSWAEIARQHLR